MDEPHEVCALTDEERHLLRRLRHGPQQTQDLFQRLDGNVGLVRLFRYDTLRDGLAE